MWLAFLGYPNHPNSRLYQYPPPMKIYYDGECNVCKLVVQKLISYDRKGQVSSGTLQDLASDESETRRLGLNPNRIQEGMLFVDKNGIATAGFFAFKSFFSYTKRPLGLYLLFNIPLVWIPGTLTYKLFSKNRRRFGCGSSTCDLKHPH